MSIEHFIIGILVALIIGLQGFWMFIVFRLNDRLMSRNYQDFATGERLKKPTNASKASQKSAVFDPIAEQNAEKANAFFIA